MNFTVTLSFASPLTTTVNYYTQDGSALAGEDYQAATGTVTFAPGQTTRTVTVYLIGDTKYEGDETFHLYITNPTNATLYWYSGNGTVANDDAQPTVTVSDIAVVEGNSGWPNAVFTASLSAVSGVMASFSYYTQNGTAIDGLDYFRQGNYAFIPAGQLSATISVP